MSQKHKKFFHRVIFIVGLEYELEIDENYAIKPVSALPVIFGTFARNYPITFKLFQNIEGVILIKNKKKLAIFTDIYLKLSFEI